MLPLADAGDPDQGVLARRARARAWPWTSSTPRATRSWRGEVGELVCRKPFPGMTRGFWRDPERYLDTYWRRFPGIWTHGDWASVDEDGYWFLHGRSDDTLNIAGKRIGPAELESAAVAHPAVSEAAAVGVPHEVKGEVAWVFCVLVPGREPARRARRARSRRSSRPSSARRSGPSAIVFVAACRRRGARRSSGARCGRRRSGPTRATCRRSRTPRPWRRSPMPSELDASHSSPAAAAGSARTSHARSPRTAGRSSSARGRATRSRRSRRRSAGGAVELDVADRESVERAVAEAGDVDLLVANAGIAARAQPTWEVEPEDWWHVLEVNVLRRPSLLPGGDPRDARARPGRIVITGSGAAYLPGIEPTRPTGEQGGRVSLRRDARTTSSAAGSPSSSSARARRDGDDERLRRRRAVDAPELAPQLVVALAVGRADALAGRYLHAEHDDIDDLIAPRGRDSARTT